MHNFPLKDQTLDQLLDSSLYSNDCYEEDDQEELISSNIPHVEVCDYDQELLLIN